MLNRIRSGIIGGPHSRRSESEGTLINLPSTIYDKKKMIIILHVKKFNGNMGHHMKPTSLIFFHIFFFFVNSRRAQYSYSMVR